LPRLRVIPDAVLSATRKVLAAVWWLLARPIAAVAWVRGFRSELWIVEGQQHTSGLPLSILCGLKGESKTYVLDMIFGDTFSQRRLGRYWWWNLHKAMSKAPGCSLIVLDSDVSHVKFAPGGDWFLIPVWLLGAVDLPYEKNVHNRLRTKIRSIIRRQSFEFEVTRDPRQFDDFYHNMYVPYARLTYGKCARVGSHEFMSGVFRQSELLLLKRKGESIAGYLMMHSPAGPYLWESGIRDGNRQHVEDGAGSAMYHFCLEYLHAQGHQKAYLGWSRTFLRDGVLVFKKRLAQRIVASNNNGFALRIFSHTPGTKAFLHDNPFLFKRGGDLYAAVFVDGEEPLCGEEIERIEKEYFHPGMARLCIYHLPGEQADVTAPVPPPLAGRVEVRSPANGRLGSTAAQPRSA
jgi:hypothetical protein